MMTSRKPDVLDAYCAKAIEEFGEGVHDLLRSAWIRATRALTTSDLPVDEPGSILSKDMRPFG